MGAKKKHVPGCGCCGSVSECPCTGTCFPNQWSITIAGVTNGTCTNCTEANTTFTVTYNPGDTTPTSCTWLGAIESFACSGAGVLTGPTMSVYSSGGSHFLRVSLIIGDSGGGSPTIAVWEKEYPSGVPCGALFNVSIPLITSTNSECNTTVATCRVTAFECYERGCVASLTQPPNNFDVVFAGFGNDVCTTCTSLNATFGCAYVEGESSPGSCVWESGRFTLCDIPDNYVRIELNAGAGSYQCIVQVRDATFVSAQWSLTQGTPFDTASWASASIPFAFTNLADCSYPSGDPTCAVTAA